MYFGKMKFDTIPDVGFAISHYSRDYKTSYGRNGKMSVEIAYITSGRVKLTLYDKDMYAGEGNVIVIFRHLPVSTQTLGSEVQSHHTVLAEFTDYDFTLLEDYKDANNAFVIPFVLKSCAQTEEIAKTLCRISVDMAENREKNSLKSAVEFLSLLSKISDIAKEQNIKGSRANKTIAERVCDYVADNIEKNISMSDISSCVSRTPNHISYAFKSEMGMTIKEYINTQKTKKIADLMQNDGDSFALACEKVAISDITYGYRVFKRYMGVTPKGYITIKKIYR